MSKTNSKKDVSLNSESTSRTSLQSPLPAPEGKVDTPTLKKEKVSCKVCKEKIKSSLKSCIPAKLPSLKSQSKSQASPCSAALQTVTPEQDVSRKKSSGSVTYINHEQRSPVKSTCIAQCSKPTCSQQTASTKPGQRIACPAQPISSCPCSSKSYSAQSASAPQTERKYSTSSYMKEQNAGYCSNQYGSVSYINPESYGAATCVKPESTASTKPGQRIACPAQPKSSCPCSSKSYSAQSASAPQTERKYSTSSYMKEQNAGYCSNQYGSVSYINPESYGAATCVKPESTASIKPGQRIACPAQSKSPCPYSSKSYSAQSASAPQTERKYNTSSYMKEQNAGYYSNQYGSVSYIKPESYGAATCVKPESKDATCPPSYGAVTWVKPESKDATYPSSYGAVTWVKPESKDATCPPSFGAVTWVNPESKDATGPPSFGAVTYVKPKCRNPEVCVIYEKDKGKMSYTPPKETRKQSIDIEEIMKQIDERKIKKRCVCIKTDAPESKFSEKATDKTVCGGSCPNKSNTFSTTSVPISLRFKRSTKDTSTRSAKGTSKKSSLENMSSSKHIVLPEVKIEIGPERLQTIQIDVKPSNLDSKSSGIITIPVQLRFRKCCQNDEETVSAKAEEERQAILKLPRIEKLLFEACANREYFENYMEALVEELPEIEKQSKKSIRNLEKLQPKKLESAEQLVATIELEHPESKVESEPQDTEELKAEDGQSLTKLKESDISESKIPKTEIIKETPWYEALDNENYIESYLVEGYSASTDNVGVQTDLLLGEKLLSTSLNSFNEDKPQVPGCRCGTKDVKASVTIKWDQFIFLPEVLPEKKYRKSTVAIIDDKTPEENASEPPKMFSVPPDQKPEPASSELPPLEPLPEKYSFVFRQNCTNDYEPYLQALLREIKLKEVESPCGLKPKLPWTQLLLPDSKKNTIRRIVKLKVEPKPIFSKSAPCCCGLAPEDKTTSLYTDSDKSGLGYNSLMPFNTSNKTNPTLSNKVTFKMDKNQPPSCQCGSRDYQISPKNSKMVTCRYINRDLKDSPYNSKLELTNSTSSLESAQNSKTCQLNTCEYKKPKFSLKPDPVVAAFHACEAELRPMRAALSAVKQKLQNLNMPELDCMFRKCDFDDIPPITKPCRCRNMRPKTPPSGPLNISRTKYSANNNYNIPNSNSYQNYNQSSSSRKSLTNCGCQTLKRNKAIQKTGSMYKTNIRKRKCISFHSDHSFSTDTTRYTPSEDDIKPCSAGTQPKLGKSPSKRPKDKQISQMSLAKLTDSMCPFIEAIKSIFIADNTNTKVTKCGREKNISCDANLMTKQKKKMRVHMRIRPSTRNKV